MANKHYNNMNYKHLFAARSDFYRKKAYNAPFLAIAIPMLLFILSGFFN